LNKKLFNICCKKQTLQMNLQATIVKPEARPTAVHHICKQHPWANSELEVDVICRGHAALSYCWQSGGPGCSTTRHWHHLRLGFNSSLDPQYKYMIISQSYSIASAMNWIELNWNNFLIIGERVAQEDKPMRCNGPPLEHVREHTVKGDLME